MTDATTTEQQLLVTNEGRGMRVTLNRPRAINAITLEMIGGIEDALDALDRGAAELLIIDGAGERGLCAGGDVTMNINFSAEQMVGFWEREYDVNRRINRAPVPVVPFMDGITMGGGIGLSAHASNRVVTERTRIAMPEVRIGFIPDVGGSLLLARMPGLLGLHIALTAGSMNGADAVVTGFADAYVASDKLEQLKHDLAHGTVSVGETIATYAQAAPESELLQQRDWIDECYRADTVLGILANLDAHANATAQEAAAEIRKNSPNALEAALAAFHRARELDDLSRVLDMELAVGEALIRTPDMQEGVRALIVDKDKNPQWQPASLDDVDRDWIHGLVHSR